MKTGFPSVFASIALRQVFGENVRTDGGGGLTANPWRGLVSVAFSAAFAICSWPCLGDNRSTYTGSTAQITYSDWMRWVPDSVLLSELSIPATHDTMADHGGGLVRTQSMPLSEQLKAGVRALDIRARHIEDRFAMHHGDVFLGSMFGDVLSACNDFLDSHPTETILIWLSKAGVPEDSNVTRSFTDTYLWYRDQSGLGSKIITLGRRAYNTPLGDLRGRIVMIQDWGCTSCGLHGGNIVDTDFWNLDTIFDMPAKWDSIVDQLRVTETGSNTNMYSNSLNGSSDNGGIWPIDVVNGVLGYEGMNSRALKYFFAGNQDRTTGLVWTDFPGAALISALIAHNMRFATNIPAMANDFEKMVEQISYAMTEDGKDASLARAKQLKAFLKHILPEHYWSVLVSASLGSDNWGFSVSTDGLFHKTDWIDGYSHVAINARRINADITQQEILTYLTPQLLASLSGDAVARASGVRTLLQSQFPWARWNVAVKRLPFEAEDWGAELDAAASASVLMVDEGEVYLCTAWATVGFNRAPVANAGPDYIASEGSTVIFNATSSTDPDGDSLQYRWDFDGDGVWDTGRSTDPIASWTYYDNLSTLAKLEVFDGALTDIVDFAVKIQNVAPAIEAGGPAVVGKDLKLKRECHFIDPGADTWEIEITYGDGTRTREPQTGRAFTIEHIYPAPGDYTVRIRLWDDDGDLGSATFTVQAGVNSAPTPANDRIEITSAVAGTEIRLSIAKLLNNDADPDSDPFSLKEVSAQSANLRNIRRDGDWLFYSVPPAPASTDSFTYTVMDSAGAEGTATVQIVLMDHVDPPPNLISLTRLPNGTVRLLFAGIPGRAYAIQASSSLSSLNWIGLGNVKAAANGFVTFEDADAPGHASRFYRTISAQ